MEFIIGNVAENLVAFTKDLEYVCNMHTDSHTMIKASVLFIAVHMVIAYCRDNFPDKLEDNEEGGNSRFRLLSVAS